jgi:hypothetical protein
MVQMQMGDRTLLSQYHAWYREHVRKLVSIPGFLSGQRFESTTPSPSPFLAVYNLDSAGVLTSEHYTKTAGPDSTKEWKPRLSNWYRDLLEGPSIPSVPPDGWLAILDRHTDTAPSLPAQCIKLNPVRIKLSPTGLEHIIVERGVMTGGPQDSPPSTSENADLSARDFRPLSPMVKSTET